MHTFYRQAGEGGRTVVLIHGVGLDHRMWDDLSARLVAAGHRVLCYDLLGHGCTPALGGDVELRDFSEQLQRLLEGLQIDAATLVGFSLGALVARAYAVRDQTRLSRLVLLNSVYGRTREQRDAVRHRYRQACENGLASLVDAALERWFSAGFAQARPDIVAQVRERLANNEPGGFLPAYRVFADARDETVDQLGSISIPTLVITGELDVGSTPAMSEQLARLIPNARSEVLAGARHMLPVERADWLSDTLQHFMRDVGGRMS